MKELLWEHDEITEYWANKLTVPIKSTHPLAQYEGENFDLWEDNWRDYICNKTFPSYCRHPNRNGYLSCSPTNIIKCFTDGYVLEALALTVGWGSMVRSKVHVYKEPLVVIKQNLINCYSLIEEENSVEGVWKLLVDKLRWGNVITSKTLHFLTRSMGHEINPPVPIDKTVIIDKVWKKFNEMAKIEYRRGIELLPDTWRNSTWKSYNCYMTAINCWADTKGWTTTQVENTLYEEFWSSKC